MSLADNVSRPLPVLARLAAMLRNMPALQFVFAKFASLRRRHKMGGERTVGSFVDEEPGARSMTVDQPMADSALTDDIVIAEPHRDLGLEGEQLACDVGFELSPSRFVGEASGVTPDVVEQPVAAAKLFDEIAIAQPAVIAEPELDARCERERLIRRRWMETGIKMWNPDIHGAGRAALNIQGRVGVLPLIPGDVLPGYDKLEFRLTDGQIVCEGVVVEPREASEIAGSRDRRQPRR